jgi:curved DNA-binding protein CbpA
MLEEEFVRELNSVSKVIDDLDYYQILKLDQMAFDEDIKKAYFEESRVYHPDKYYNEAAEIQEKINKIFKRVCEAYKVLSDQEKRALYTKLISGTDRKKYLRFDLRLLKEATEKKEDEGQNPLAKKYYKMAKTAFQNKDFKAAKINLQLAIKVEPNNQTFLDKLKEVDEILNAKRQYKAPKP